MPILARVILPLLAVLAASVPAVAQPCGPIQVRNPDGNYIVPGVKGDIPYSGSLAFDAYVPPGGGRRPAVMLIHGGEWSSGGRSAHVGQLLEVLSRAGYAWFSVDYRLGGLERYRDSLADLRAALAFIRCHAADWPIDPDRVILIGEDSGAHLAALLAAESSPGVIGTVLIGGFYDLAALPTAARTLRGDGLPHASPVSRVGSGMPPSLVIHGTADSEVPIEQARRYCTAVSGAGRCHLVEVTGASHRSENWWPSQWDYKKELVDWLSALAPVRPVPGGPGDGRLHKDIVYNATKGLKLDAFIPAGDGPLPAVIVVHGGGWEAGDKVTYVTPVFEPLARAGLAWFSIDYRLTPAVENRDQIEDVRQAVRFVRAEHARFNIDPARIVLLGESASGQLVSMVAADDDAIAGVVSFYGVYDFPAMVTDASPRSLLARLFRRTALDDEARAVMKQYSPIHHAHTGMPPVLLVNGTGERLWAQAQAFADRLKALGVPHEVIALEGAPHGMENWEGHPEWTGYKQRLVDWIDSVVEPKPAR